MATFDDDLLFEEVSGNIGNDKKGDDEFWQWRDEKNFKNW